MPERAKDTATGRTYQWIDGKSYTSVTTAISDGIPKPGLARWMAKRVAEEAARRRKELALVSRAPDVVESLMAALSVGGNTAAISGTRIHAFLDKIVNGIDVGEIPLEFIGYIEGFYKFLEDWKPKYVETEATVYSREHGYAGTLDALIIHDGRYVVLDYKTGKGVWPEAALQLAAYANAEFIGRSDGTEQPMPSVKRAAVLHLRPEGYEYIPVIIEPIVFETFLSALDIHRWMRDHSKYVIGEPRERREGTIDANVTVVEGSADSTGIPDTAEDDMGETVLEDRDSVVQVPPTP